MKKKIIVFTAVFLLGGVSFVGFSSGLFWSPVSINAQQTPEFSFDEINENVKANNSAPNYALSEKIAGALFENLSVLEVPVSIQDSLASEVANLHLNGSSTIDESNIVSAVNNLASQASAPSYAYTNIEQVQVVRTFLNRLIPDLVSPHGNMSDLEAYAVFLATVSQKIDNEAFMVSPTEFTNSLNSSPPQPFPGSSEFINSDAGITQNTARMNEMRNVISGYANSKNLASTTDVLNSIGIN